MTAPTARWRRARPAGVGRTLVRGVGQTADHAWPGGAAVRGVRGVRHRPVRATKQAAATVAVDRVWAEAEATATVVAPGSGRDGDGPARSGCPGTTRSLGEGFAKLRIPVARRRLRLHRRRGHRLRTTCTSAPGHYTETQLPGEQGNFAVAGHRVSKGSPFNELGLLNSCDAIVVETQDDWFVYRVLPMAEEEATWTSTPRAQCDGVQRADRRLRGGVRPGDHAADRLRPGAAGAARRLRPRCPPDAQRLITLTTCHPQFSDAERMIIHGVLVQQLRQGAGLPAARTHRDLTGDLMYAWIWRHLPGPTAARIGAFPAAVPGCGGPAVLRRVPLAGALPAVRPRHHRLTRADQHRRRGLSRRLVPHPSHSG